MSESRVKNTKRNIVSGVIKQLMHMLLTFSIRTAIIYKIGAEYQGLDGLFTSILQVLNMTELGFSTAVMYTLYKPIADKDISKVCAIINYLKKVYLYVGGIILVVGLGIIPFLSYIVTGDVPGDVNIHLLFVVYLLNTAVSYFLFAYKNTLFMSMQRDDIVSNVYTLTTTITNLLQLAVVIVLKNYYLYVFLLPIGTIINNVMLEYMSHKYYPNIQPVGELSQKTKSELSTMVKAVFLGKVGDVARNSFDNIVISMFMGLISITIYTNYYYIYSALYCLMGIIIHGIIASVGNSIATESKEKNYSDLKVINFIFMWIVSICTICLLCLYQPFMLVWMNNNPAMLLSGFDMCLFCIYFYVINMTYVRSMYLDGFGLFYECRYLFIWEALGNLTLNLILGYWFGISGIIIATILTIFFLNFIGRTHILFKYYFGFSPKKFYYQHVLYFFVTVIAGLLTYYISSIQEVYGVMRIVVNLIICIVVPNVVMFLIYRKNDDFVQSWNFMKKIFLKFC